jgi:peptidylprolyl isomerase
MTRAKKGDTVRVEYIGKLADGRVFDSAKGSDPLQFTVGEGEVIKGLEDAVVGMEEGERLTTTIGKDSAYGRVKPELRVAVPQENFPDSIQPEVGQRLEVRQPNGESIPVTVIEVRDEAVTLDANHVLAGRDLTFDIKLLEVV